MLFFATSFASWAQEKVYEPSVFVYVGGGFHAPRTDYVSYFGGFNAGVSFSLASGHAFMLDCSVNGGEARRDFKAAEGMILKDDPLTNGQIYFDYGHVVHQTSRTQIFPFGGIGVTDYTFELDEDREICFNKCAFSANIGLCYDIRLRERPNWLNQAIRIKPYAAVSFYNGPLRVVPSFNVSVLYCIGL